MSPAGPHAVGGTGGTRDRRQLGAPGGGADGLAISLQGVKDQSFQMLLAC